MDENVKTVHVLTDIDNNVIPLDDKSLYLPLEQKNVKTVDNIVSEQDSLIKNYPELKENNILFLDTNPFYPVIFSKIFKNVYYTSSSENENTLKHYLFFNSIKNVEIIDNIDEERKINMIKVSKNINTQELTKYVQEEVKIVTSLLLDENVTNYFNDNNFDKKDYDVFSVYTYTKKEEIKVENKKEKSIKEIINTMDKLKNESKHDKVMELYSQNTKNVFKKLSQEQLIQFYEILSVSAYHTKNLELTTKTADFLLLNEKVKITPTIIKNALLYIYSIPYIFKVTVKNKNISSLKYLSNDTYQIVGKDNVLSIYEFIEIKGRGMTISQIENKKISTDCANIKMMKEGYFVSSNRDDPKYRKMGKINIFGNEVKVKNLGVRGGLFFPFNDNEKSVYILTNFNPLQVMRYDKKDYTHTMCDNFSLHIDSSSFQHYSNLLQVENYFYLLVSGVNNNTWNYRWIKFAKNLKLEGLSHPFKLNDVAGFCECIEYNDSDEFVLGVNRGKCLDFIFINFGVVNENIVSIGEIKEIKVVDI